MIKRICNSCYFSAAGSGAAAVRPIDIVGVRTGHLVPTHCNPLITGYCLHAVGSAKRATAPTTTAGVHKQGRQHHQNNTQTFPYFFHSPPLLCLFTWAIAALAYISQLRCLLFLLHDLKQTWCMPFTGAGFLLYGINASLPQIIREGALDFRNLSVLVQFGTL